MLVRFFFGMMYGVSFFGADKYGVTLELEVLSDWFRSGK